MGLCLTKQYNVEIPSKIEEDPRQNEEEPRQNEEDHIILKPRIEIKFIDSYYFSILNKTKKISSYKRIFKSKLTIKAINKIRLRKRRRYNKRPPFK